MFPPGTSTIGASVCPHLQVQLFVNTTGMSGTSSYMIGIPNIRLSVEL